MRLSDPSLLQVLSDPKVRENAKSQGWVCEGAIAGPTGAD